MQVAYGIRQGPVPICRNCAAQWSRDGSMLYVAFLPKTFAIQLRDGEMLPQLPPGGITAENVMTLPVVKIYNDTPLPGGLYASDSLSRYAFARETTNRNIYRIPLR